MNSPVHSYTDELAARAEVTTHGNICFIAIPDAETLSESVHLAALQKAERRLRSGPPDADVLRMKLREITPPLDQEEEDAESRLLEAEAREDLENDGCPACYPPYLDVPVRSPPEEYRCIVDYWKSFSSTGDVVLCSQRSDWRKFRGSQQRLRNRYHNKNFSSFVDEVRKRQQKYGLYENVHLLWDWQQQSRQQNWVEFQDFHFKFLEQQEKKRDKLRMELDDAQAKASDTDNKVSEDTAQRKSGIQRHLEYVERILKWHKVLLEWIGQQRHAMDPQPLTPVEEDDSDPIASPPTRPRAATRQRRSRQLNSSAVLGKVRISKSTPKSPKLRSQTFKAIQTKPIVADLDVTITCGTQQISKHQDRGLRCAKETSLGQLHPLTVAEANRFADAGTITSSGSQCNDTGQLQDRAKAQHRSAPRRSYSAPESVKTRSGRISRPPARWPSAELKPKASALACASNAYDDWVNAFCKRRRERVPGHSHGNPSTVERKPR